MQSDTTAIICKLRKDILQWEGYKPPAAGMCDGLGLGPLESVFPNGVFPVGTVHEVVCANSEEAAAANGLVSGILSVLMRREGVCVWIGRSQRLFPPAFAGFGVLPHKVIFISLVKDKEALWVMEEALKCSGLKAVICELQEMDFKQSRRLQLAVEHSHVTGFVLRNSSAKLGSTTCAARWRVRPLPSESIEGLPGLGFLRWKVELLKVRNGKTGSWVMEWKQNCFKTIQELPVQEERQVG